MTSGLVGGLRSCGYNNLPGGPSQLDAGSLTKVIRLCSLFALGLSMRSFGPQRRTFEDIDVNHYTRDSDTR